MKKKAQIFIVIILVIISLESSMFAVYDFYQWTDTEDTITVSNGKKDNDVSFEKRSSILNGENLEETNQLDLKCESCILIEQTTGQILYTKNSHEKLHPASVTKIMSILLIMEQIDSGKLKYEDKIPCSSNAANMGGSQIWLDTKETLSVEEMLKAICIVSANDCVVALAEHIAGSEEAFVQLMNEKAKELKMNDTVFKNCHGLDEDGHETSAYDIAIMSRELLTNHPEITNYTTTVIDSLREGKSQLVNTNKLLRNYQGCTGLKTGSTSLALFNLSASATRDGLSLIAVVMKSPTSKERFNDAEKILNYGFANYSFVKFAKKNEKIKSIRVLKGIDDCIDVYFKNDEGVLIPKGQEQNISQEISIQENVEAPVYKGEKLGEVTYSLNNEVIGKIDIVANNDISKIGIFTMSSKILEIWVKLFR